MAMQTMELEPDAFWRMVTQENLKVAGPSAGYQWTGKQGKNGWETYKVRAQPIGWLYQFRRVATMAGGAGAEAFVVRMRVPTGETAKLITFFAQGAASAGATLLVDVIDEDAAQNARLGSYAAGASRQSFLPQPGSGSTVHQANIESSGLILGPGQYLRVTSSAAANAETLTVAGVFLLSAPFGTATEFVFDLTGSGGTPTLAASTISAANTLQAVYL